jgi:hypothetical protein
MIVCFLIAIPSVYVVFVAPRFECERREKKVKRKGKQKIFLDYRLKFFLVLHFTMDNVNFPSRWVFCRLSWNFSPLSYEKKLIFSFNSHDGYFYFIFSAFEPSNCVCFVLFFGAQHQKGSTRFNKWSWLYEKRTCMEWVGRWGRNPHIFFIYSIFSFLLFIIGTFTFILWPRAFFMLATE